ncbi:MAG: hypothetical protein LBV04_06305 [Deferribacteraceae bacterium]|nr:hypothetical protein [Deferribacteraceae bacterium]
MYASTQLPRIGNEVAFRQEFQAYVNAPSEHGLSMIARMDITEEDLHHIGDKAAIPSFVLWGDSHANSWAPALDAAASKYKASGYMFAYTQGLCSPTFDKRQGDGCTQLNDTLMSLIEQKQIKDVIITHNDIFDMANYAYTLDRLQSLSVNIWYIESVPIFHEPVPMILLRKHVFGVDSQPALLAGAEYYKREKASLLATQTDNFRILKIVPTICTEDTCNVDSENGPLYADRDHLSVLGALFYQDTFKPIFEGVHK